MIHLRISWLNRKSVILSLSTRQQTDSYVTKLMKNKNVGRVSSSTSRPAPWTSWRKAAPNRRRFVGAPYWTFWAPNWGRLAAAVAATWPPSTTASNGSAFYGSTRASVRGPQTHAPFAHLKPRCDDAITSSRNKKNSPCRPETRTKTVERRWPQGYWGYVIRCQVSKRFKNITVTTIVPFFFHSSEWTSFTWCSALN